MIVDTMERPVLTADKRHRWLVLPLALALIAGTAATVALIGRDEGILVSDGAGVVSRLNARTGETEFVLTDAVRAPDDSFIYRYKEAAGSTLVEVLDPKSGEVRASTSLAGSLEIRAVAPLGGAVALMASRQASADLYVPQSREFTSINVVWNEGREPRNYTLKGNLEPETFSTDEGTLFLLEFWPSTAPDRYFVRQLDLDSGTIENVSTPDQEEGIELNPEMRGHARAQVMSPDGSFLFSLYTIGEGEKPVHDPAAPAEARWAFVHTLNLKEKWSHCIFLPLPFGTGTESAMSLGISGDSRDLFVIDGATQHVARIDARRLRVERVQEIPGLLAQNARPVAVGPNVVYIGLHGNVLEMGRESLIPNAAFVINTESSTLPILGLELAPDGRTLRISHGVSISVLDMPTERVIASLTSPGRSGSSYVGPPVGQRTLIDLEWVIP
jgi:hypothetical protein